MNVMMMEMNTETMDSGSVYMLVSMLMLLHDDDVAHDDDDDDDDNDDDDDDNVDDEVRRGSSPLLAAPAPRLRRGAAARTTPCIRRNCRTRPRRISRARLVPPVALRSPRVHSHAP